MSCGKYFMHIHEDVYYLMSSGKYFMHIQDDDLL